MFAVDIRGIPLEYKGEKSVAREKDPRRFGAMSVRRKWVFGKYGISKYTYRFSANIGIGDRQIGYR